MRVPRELGTYYCNNLHDPTFFLSILPLGTGQVSSERRGADTLGVYWCALKGLIGIPCCCSLYDTHVPQTELTLPLVVLDS